MISTLPIWISLFFILITILTISLFHFSNSRPFKITAAIVVWAILHSVLSYFGFYENTSDFPPRFGIILIPFLILLVSIKFPFHIDWIYKNRDTSKSTFLHIVRLPVEIVLHLLCLHALIPELMTYEGRNFDILMGISAPIIGFLYFKKKISKKALLSWNVIGLFMIVFIFINGLLSAPLPFQQFGFAQPNVAVIYFPFVLLPAVVVPIVMWTHITDIIKISNELWPKS